MERDVEEALARAQTVRVKTTCSDNAEALRWYYLDLLSVGFSRIEALEITCRLQEAWWRNPNREQPNPQEQ